MILKTSRTAAAPKKPVIEGTIAYVDLYEIVGDMTNGKHPLFRAKKIGARNGDVVVRPFSAGMFATPDSLQRIRNAYRRLTALRHSNIVPLLELHDIGEVRYACDEAHEVFKAKPGDLLVVAEYVNGRSLDAWINEFPDSKVPTAAAEEAVRQICAGLDYAHRSGIYHLDLKMQNVIVETRKNDKLVFRVTDFSPAMDELNGSEGADCKGVAFLALEMMTGSASESSVSALAPKVADVIRKAIETEGAYKTCGEFAKAFSAALKNEAARPGRRHLLIALIVALTATIGISVYLRMAANQRAVVRANEEKLLEVKRNAERKAAEKAAAEKAAAEAAEKERLRVESEKQAEKAAREAEAKRAREEAEKKAAAEKIEREMKLEAQRAAAQAEADRLRLAQMKAEEARRIEEARKAAAEELRRIAEEKKASEERAAKAKQDELALREKFFVMGRAAENPAAAAEYYKMAADMGHVAAQRELGLCYDGGKGVAENPAVAAELYRKAADEGDLLAKALLSQCYYFGTGVKRDYAMAWSLARASADGDCAFGQYMAGVCCETGCGAIRSRLNAKKWYELAIEQGLDCARERLAKMKFK